MTEVSQRAFRAVALQRLSSPEQLDHLVGITRPFDWILTIVICLALAAALTWGVLGRIPTRALGEGILVSSGGRVVDSVSAAAGRLSSVDVSVGDHVSQGQIIAHIAQTDIEQKQAAAIAVFHEREREIQQSEFTLNDARRQMQAIAGTLNQNTQVASPIEGRVLEIKVSAGSVLAIGTPVISIESEGTTLEALVYLAVDRGKSVKPGMQVRVEPSTVKREEFGTMLGTVLTLSDFPITPQGMAAVLHNDSLVTRFSRDGAPYAATIRLEQDPSTVSGYRWAVGKGPPLRLTSGTLTRAEITTRMQRPLDLIIPLIRRITGIDG